MTPDQIIVDECTIRKPCGYDPHKKLIRAMMKCERQHQKINPKAVIRLRRLEKKWAGMARKLRFYLGV